MRVSHLFAYILDIITPPRRTEEIVRSTTLEYLRSIILRGDKSGSLPYHDERVTALVWELKYYADAHAARLAAEILAEVIVGVASESLGVPLLIPIPMHAARRRQRGHNQTEVLCEATLPYIQGCVQYVPGALTRIKSTPAQQGLHKHERERNLTDSMLVFDTERVRGRVCIVVDDVSTTGATFAEATRALTEAGAGRVECVALAYS
jgi:ComF family protein